MTTEQKWEFLLCSAEHVACAFQEGRNPTFDQLEKLNAAIEAVKAMKVCGHRIIEECDCEP